jgi:hypothetical protein
MKIDKNGNGLLDIDEFGNFLKGLGLNISEKERNLVFKSVDTNNSGQITFEQLQMTARPLSFLQIYSFPIQIQKILESSEFLILFDLLQEMLYAWH